MQQEGPPASQPSNSPMPPDWAIEAQSTYQQLLVKAKDSLQSLKTLPMFQQLQQPTKDMVDNLIVYIAAQQPNAFLLDSSYNIIFPCIDALNEELNGLLL